MSQVERREFKIPSIIKKMTYSKMDRRSFLIKTALAGMATAIPLVSCGKEQKTKIAIAHDPAVLSIKEWDILVAVQDILFPSEEGSPGARELNAAVFVQWVISDTDYDPEERKFLKSGLEWLDEDALERWEKPFLNMLPENREKLLKHIESAHDWGESWLSVMLLHIFEALFSDPVYGTNAAQEGLKWLQYTAGQPTPKVKYNDQLARNNEQ